MGDLGQFPGGDEADLRRCPVLEAEKDGDDGPTGGVRRPEPVVRTAGKIWGWGLAAAWCVGLLVESCIVPSVTGGEERTADCLESSV